MIPKTIHYCWFGKNPKSELILRCIASWRKYCPDFEIIEWNEENFDVAAHPFTKLMYTQKHWAFVSDYARLVILERGGGIYLDADMLLVQSISPLLVSDCFLGEEETGIISAGALGAVAFHPFTTLCKQYYDAHSQERVTIPRVLTQIFSAYQDKVSITVYPPETFYPFDADHIKDYRGQALPKTVYGVHLWNYSWGSPVNKFFRRIGIHAFGKRMSELLGIKKLLKKLLGFV